MKRILCAAIITALGMYASVASAATMVMQIKSEQYQGGNTWNNLVTGRPDLVQNADGSRPQYIANATPSGAAEIYFDGNDDWFHIGVASEGILATDADAHRYTVIGVIRPDEEGNASRTITGGGFSAFNLRVGGDADGDRLRINSQGWAPAGTSTAELPNDQFTLFTASVTPSSHLFRFNGVEVGSGGGPGELFQSAFQKIGALNDGSEPFKGSIVELRIFIGDITLGEIQANESQLAAYLTPVPEPSSLAILGLGIGGCALALLRRKKA